MQATKYFPIRLTIYVFTLCLLLGCSTNHTLKVDIDKLLQKSEDEILTEVKTQPDKDINLGAVALILAKGYHPDIDVKKYLNQLDQMALELKQKIGREKEPEKVIRLMNEYIYKTNKIEAYYDPDTTKSFALNSVIDNKSGDCLGLSILYLTMGERLNLPLYAVGAPSHMFIRYDNGSFQRNIETVEEGKMISDNDYIKWLKEPEKVILRNVSKTDMANMTPEQKKQIRELIAPTILLPNDVVKKGGGYFANLSKKDVIIELIHNYAFAYGKKNKKEMVKIMENKAIALNITKPYHWMIIGTPFWQIGDYENAIKCATESIKQEPDFHLFYFQRAYFYDGAGKLSEVESDCTKAIELCPNNPIYYHRRGRNYDLMKEYDKALADFNKVVELSPDEYKGYFARGVVLYRQEEYDKALKDLDKAIELNQDYPNAYYIRGILNQYKNRADEALGDFKKYLQLDPNGSNAQDCKKHIEEFKVKENQNNIDNTIPDSNNK